MMPTFGAGNFDSDGAMDYLGETMESFIERVEKCFSQAGCVALDEDGESVIMPTMELMAILAEECGAAPPQPAVVNTWREKYLQAFDQQIDELEPLTAYKNERRRVIEQTFDRLETQARKFWES